MKFVNVLHFKLSFFVLSDTVGCITNISSVPKQVCLVYSWLFMSSFSIVIHSEIIKQISLRLHFRRRRALAHRAIPRRLGRNATGKENKQIHTHTHTLQQADTLLHTQKCIDLDAARRLQVSDHDTMRHAPIVRWCLSAPALLRPCRDADVWCKRIVSGHSCLRSLGGCIIGGGYRNSVLACCGLAVVVHSDGKDSLVGFLLLLFCFMMIICRCTYKMFCMALFSVNVPAECSTIRFAMAAHQKKKRVGAKARGPS